MLQEYGIKKNQKEAERITEDTTFALTYKLIMKKSNINFTVHLDANNIPDKIFWDATEKPEPGLSETKSISIALWDEKEKNTLRIDLWSKDMPVEEMKRFYIDCIGGMAQSMMNSTGDEFMAKETNALCEKLVEHLRKETNS